MVFPANGWVVGYDVLGAIVTCFGFMLLINDGFSYAGFERVGCVSVAASGWSSLLRGMGLVSGWKSLNVSGVSL
jgi:hypothetical protein